jgi:hypothetical protein
VVRSFFNILSSSRSASSICDDFRDPLATLLTKEGLTFNLLAILAYTPAKADMIFPGVRPPDPGQSRTDVFSCRPIAFIADADTRGNAISSLSWQARLYEVLRACCSLPSNIIVWLQRILFHSAHRHQMLAYCANTPAVCPRKVSFVERCSAGD